MLILKEVEGFSIEEIGGSSESEWQYGESEALSGPGAGGKPGEEAPGIEDQGKSSEGGGGCGNLLEEP